MPSRPEPALQSLKALIKDSASRQSVGDILQAVAAMSEGSKMLGGIGATMSARRPSQLPADVLARAIFSEGAFREGGPATNFQAMLSALAPGMFSEQKPDPIVEMILAAAPFGMGAKAQKIKAIVSGKEKNYLAKLSDYADTLYRETSIERALQDIPGSRVYAGAGAREEFFSNVPELALGQGSNKGVLLEIDPVGLEGQIVRNKPGLQMVAEEGMAEFLGQYLPGSLGNNVRSITIRKDASGSKSHVLRLVDTVKALEANGWKKEALEDGSVVLRRPKK